MADRPGADTVDVLVVGAGPTGLALAAQAHAHGASVRLVDRSPDAVHESRALAVQPRTLEVLRSTGVSDRLVSRGNGAVRLVLHGEGVTARVRLFDLGVDDTAYPFILFVSQAETEAALVEHLAGVGVSVERGIELVELTSRGREGVTALLSGPRGTEEVPARFLAGCDGARSTVRRLVDIPFRGEAYPQTFALADLEVDGAVQPDAVHTFFTRQGLLFLFPLLTPATWRLITIRGSGRSADGLPSLTLPELQRLVDVHTGGALRLRDPVWISDFRLSCRQATRYRSGPVFLAGDAAHVHSPAGGQGMNTGIQDAWNLGWKLALVARGLAADDLLESYEVERWPVGRDVLRFTDRLFTIATTGRLAALRTRVAPRVAPLVMRLPLRSYGFRIVGQLAVSYRGSPAVSDEGGRRPGWRPRRGLRAGDRLPDIRVAVAGTAGAVRLHDVVGAPGYHVLRLDDGPAPDVSPYGSTVFEHRIHGWRAGRSVVVVRPDGHVGHAGTAPGAAAYLRRWLRPEA